MGWESFWKYIDLTSQVMGILATLPIAYSALALWRMKHQQNKEMARVKKTPGNCPGVIIVECLRDGEQSMHLQVMSYLLQQGEFKDRSGDIKKYTSEACFKGTLSEANMDEMVKKVRKAVAELQAKGVDKYHIFLRGPVVLAAITGGILYNSHTAVFYQHTRGAYECWGTINR